MSSTIDTTKCILLHSYVPGKEQLIKSINCNYLEHTGFPCSEWIDTFFNDNLATLSNLTHFAFMYENNGRHMSLFPRDVDYDEYFGKFFTYFLDKLVALNSGIIIDIITCNINTDQQKARIAALETQYNIDIRYSLNETGDYNKGGDWLMESDNINIKDTYFNANINDWNHVLVFLVTADFPEHIFDVSGKRVIFWTDISGNEINPIYDASDNIISVPTGRLLNKSTITVSNLVHAVLENSSVSLWTNPVKMITPNGAFILYQNGTCSPSTGTYINENNASSTVQLTNVKYIWGSTAGTNYAALKYDGSCVIWGASQMYCTLYEYPSNVYKSVSAQLQSGVVSVTFNIDGAAAALKSDGSVVTWGQRSVGGNMNTGNANQDVSAQLQSGVNMIVASRESGNIAFAALKLDGSVVTWGGSYGGNKNTQSVSGELTSNIRMVYPTQRGFSAVTTSGKLIAWGDGNNNYGNSIITPINVSGQLQSGVVSIVAQDLACAALKSDGSVVTWGYASAGGDQIIQHSNTSVSSQLQNNVISLYSNANGTFGALKSTGAFVPWGGYVYGNKFTNAVTISAQLQSGCVEVARATIGFNIRKSDGSILTLSDATGQLLSPTVSGLLASGVRRVYKDDLFLRYRDPVAESPSNTFNIYGTAIEKNFLSISNTLISP